jgi:hypothetical protein
VKPLLAVIVVAVALLGAAVRPAPSAAATPCWKALLNDWYDGRIDNTYPLHCYSDALKHLPADVQTYSSAHDDILRALQNAKAQLRKAGKAATPTTPVPPPSGGGSSSGGGGGGGTKTATGGTGGKTTSPTTTAEPGRTTGGGLGGAAQGLNTSSPSSLPLPLIVLGALALLLVAAGAIGLVAKRRQRP